MREIKFRAFVDGCMGEPFNPLSNEYMEEERSHPSEWPKDTVFMQFTGLLDLNGKEIYEGDIVHIRPLPEKRAGDWENWSTNARKPIVYDGGAFRFDDMNLYEMMGWGGFPADVEYEVIGNIYENPDLLQ